MLPMFRKSSSLTPLLLGLLASHAAATQLVPNADKQSVQVNISARESNRLAIDGRRIQNVVPGQPGLIAVRKDEATGAIFFAMAPDQPSMGVVSLFVTDDQTTTYKLALVPRPIGAEEIILQPPADRSAAAKRTGQSDGRAASYQRRVKDLILVMTADEAGDSDVERVEVNKEMSLWEEGRLILQAKYMGREIVGEKYRLTNISKADMLLAEPELFRRDVRAVSIRNMTLAPGQATDIFIVRERKDNE